MLHKHHIIPRYAGGTDDSENIVELTVEEHAEAHRVLWEQYGRKEDYIAWKGLSHCIDREEIIRQRSSIGGHKGNESKRSRQCPGDGWFKWHINKSNLGGSRK